MRKQAIVMTKTWNKDLEKGATIEGVYLKKEVFDGKFGESEKYIIEDANGEKWGIFSSASLANQFKNIPEGSYIWVEYKGEETSKNGRPVKVYAVDYDDEYKN
jgi:hypothetical protein